MKEISSDVILKRNRKQASFPPPEEIFVIEDDDRNLTHIPQEETSTLSKDKEESNSIPTFDLLNEMFEEGSTPNMILLTSKIFKNILIFTI